jgi:hypothetical protein
MKLTKKPSSRFGNGKTSVQELDVSLDRNKGSIDREYEKSLRNPHSQKQKSEFDCQRMKQSGQFILSEYPMERPETYERIAEYLECEWW